MGVKIGDLRNRRFGAVGGGYLPMKTINRMALGTVSSLLLSAGLARVAARLDPLTRSLDKTDFRSGANEAPTSFCIAPCAYIPE
jgi:hypothetical protein